MKAIYPLCLLIAALPVAAQFTEINPGLPKPPFPCAAWADFDNDGDLDLAMTGETSNSKRFYRAARP